MPESPGASRWTRHLVYRAEHTRTTWKLRLGLVALAIAGVWLTSGWWTVAIGRSLVCDASLAPSDAILVENIDQDYLLFERAEALRRAGLARRVLVTVWARAGTLEPKGVELGTTQVMARIARVGDFEIIPVLEQEPITLNVARDVQRYLERERIHSVIVAASLFRSRRSELIYGATLGNRGIAVHCVPVQGLDRVDNWTRSWHGVQGVVEQWLKLQYYRLYVLPFRADAGLAPVQRS